VGKPTGFLEWERSGPKKRDEQSRVGDFREFLFGFDEAQAKAQGGRCMDCGVPFCQQGCPLGNRIPDWNDAVFKGNWKKAYLALDSTNNFPEFTGRLCPAPCEASCTLNINQPPVSIEYIEKEIIERAFAEGWVIPKPPRTRTGKTVAVVGSGPAGLAAAQQLNRAGHTVTVYEKMDRVGGLLRYGIPDFKLEKTVIERRLEMMKLEGVQFRMNCEIGREVSWTELKVKHDAVVVCIGAEKARDLDVPGRELQGVHFAMEYLTQQNRALQGELAVPAQRIDAKGKRVIILGGGDTGSDCLGTAHRQGALEVSQLELLPAPPAQRLPDNPWPQWPATYRTSSSQEEGGERRFALQTTHLAGSDGKVTALHAAQIRADKGPDGRLSLVREEGAEVVIPADLVILAMGFVCPIAEAVSRELGAKLDGRGNLAVDAQFRTSVPGVYAAGDARRGASLIVWAIADGREAARTVDEDLRGVGSQLPARGVDLPF
jgi:glutamate synthase (NADPH/NADH) small chain